MIRRPPRSPRTATHFPYPTFFLLWVPASPVVFLICAVLFTSAYGWAIERIAYRPLRGSFRLAPLISAIGMSIALQNYVQLAQGAKIKSLQPVIRGTLDRKSTRLNSSH